MADAGKGQRAYIGSFTVDGGSGVTVATVDPRTGTLVAERSLGEVTNPSYLALAPGSGTLYAVSETEDGAVAAFSLADSGHPELLPPGPVSVGGGGPTHLTVAAGQLFTANYGSGDVSALPVRSDGGLSQSGLRVLRHQGSGPNQDRQRGPHAHAVVSDPRWHWLLATDLGTDSVWIYRLEHTGAALSPHAEVPFASGSGPRHLSFHPRGDRAYVVSELSSSLTVCRWDGEAGKLEPVESLSTRDPGAQGANYPSALVMSVDGRFAWVANRGDDTIAVFGLDEERVSMRLLRTVSCGGNWPRDLVLDPAGRRLYAANERSGTVVWFDLDPETGTPTRGGELSAPAASCVVFA